MSQESPNEILSPVDSYLANMNEVMDETDSVRRDLQHRLTRQLNVLDAKFTEQNDKFNAEDQEAYMTTYKQLQDLLNDRDKNRMNKVSTHLKKKDTDTNNKLISHIAAENLKNTSLGIMLHALENGIDMRPGVVIVPDVADAQTQAKLDAIYKEHGIVVTKNELKDDPTCLKDEEDC